MTLWRLQLIMVCLSSVTNKPVLSQRATDVFSTGEASGGQAAEERPFQVLEKARTVKGRKTLATLMRPLPYEPCAEVSGTIDVLDALKIAKYTVHSTQFNES